MTLDERVARILEEQKLRPVQLADVAGVTKGLVSQWMGGERQEMGFDAAERIHRKYGYAIKWLINGAGDKMASEQEQEKAQALGPDVSDLAIEVAQAFDRLSADCQEHVRRQIALLSRTEANNSGRRRAAKQDFEIKQGALRAGARSKTRKGVR